MDQLRRFEMGETEERLIHTIRPDFIHEDKRGTLVQITGGGGITR